MYRTKLLELLRDEHFLELDKLVRRQRTLFEISGYSRRELAHSRILEDLLSPEREHGLGDTFLRALLQAFSTAHSEPDELEILVTRFDDVVVKREWSNIDLLIECRELKLVVAIENKIDANEHGDQLPHYRDVLAKTYPEWHRWLHFLTPTSREPSDPEWIAVGYEEIAQSLDDAIEQVGLSGQNSTGSQYANLLRSHVMRETRVKELCQKIFLKHRHAVQILIDNVPDARDETFQSVLSKATEWIGNNQDWELLYSTQPYVQFAPKKWRENARLTGADWGNVDLLIRFEFEAKKEFLVCRAVLGKASPLGMSNRMELVKALKGKNPDSDSLFRRRRNPGPTWAQLKFARELNIKGVDYEASRVEEWVTHTMQLAKDYSVKVLGRVTGTES